MASRSRSKHSISKGEQNTLHGAAADHSEEEDDTGFKTPLRGPSKDSMKSSSFQKDLKKNASFITKEERGLMERHFSIFSRRNTMQDDDSFAGVLKSSRSDVSSDAFGTWTSRDRWRHTVHQLSLTAPRIHYRYKKIRFDSNPNQCIFVQIQGIIMNVSANITQIIKIKKEKKSKTTTSYLGSRISKRSIPLSGKSTVSFIDPDLNDGKRIGQRRKSIADALDTYIKSDTEDFDRDRRARRKSLEDEAALLDNLEDSATINSDPDATNKKKDEKKPEIALWDDLQKAGYGQVRLREKQSLFELILNPDSPQTSSKEVTSKRKSKVFKDKFPLANAQKKTTGGNLTGAKNQQDETKSAKLMPPKKTKWGGANFRPSLRFNLPLRKGSTASSTSSVSSIPNSHRNSINTIPKITRANDSNEKEPSPHEKKPNQPSPSDTPKITITKSKKTKSDRESSHRVSHRLSDLNSHRLSTADDTGFYDKDRLDQNQTTNFTPNLPTLLEYNNPKENGLDEEFFSAIDLSNFEELYWKDMNEMDDAQWLRIQLMKNNNYKPSSPNSWTKLRLLQYELWKARLQVEILRQENEYLKKESNDLKMIKLVSGTELTPENLPSTHHSQSSCSNLLCSLLAVVIGVIFGKCFFS